MTGHEIVFVSTLSIATVLGALSFKWLTPRWACLLVLLGFYLFLPPNGTGWTPVGHMAFDKRVAASVALILGLAIFRCGLVLRWRPSWSDLPMGLFVVWPLFSWVEHGFLQPDVMAAQLWRQATWWAVPYWAGRLVFTTAGDARWVLKASVWAGVLYAPFAWYESLVGLEGFFGHRLFGHGLPANAERMGGIRPQVFLNGGLELCLFYAVLVAAAWWLARHARVMGMKSKWAVGVACVLTACLVGFRGVGGYLAASYALPALLFRKPKWLAVALVVLAMGPGLYMGGRAMGVVSAEQAKALGQPFSNRIAGSFGVRVGQENLAIESVRDEAPVLGLGPTKYHQWADGRWAMVLLEFGFAGLLVWWLAFFGLPAAMVCWRGWHLGEEAVATWLPQAGLLLMVCVQQADSGINHPLTPFVAFLPGVLLAQKIHLPADAS